jgi:nucleotide-binding universal stress UspA family protein
MQAHPSDADPPNALPASADQLQRAAQALRNPAGSVQAVPTLPVTLAHVQATLDLLGVGILWMAHAVANSCGEDGQTVEDSAPPEARALRWHLASTAEALRAHAKRALRAGSGPADCSQSTRSRRGRSGMSSLRHGPPVTGPTLSTIVVGYDGSPPSQRALERATMLLASGGRVVLVTASPSLGLRRVVSEPILDAPPSDERSALLRRGRALLRQRGTEATLVATDSDPVETLIQATRDDDAEMILVGQTGVRLRNACAPRVDRRERASPRTLRRAGRNVAAPASGIPGRGARSSSRPRAWEA